MQVHHIPESIPRQVPPQSPPQVPVRPLSPGGRPALGTLTKYAAASDSAAARRQERFALQAQSRAVLPDYRVASCLRAPLPDRSAVDVCYVPDRGTAHYGGLQVCGSVWVCPVCAAKISERRREELQKAIEQHCAAGGVVAIGAFTFSHRVDQPLRVILGRFLEAFRRMTRNRPYRRLMARYGAVGTVKAVEVTWGETNGWHPHCHVLFFLDGACAVDGAFQKELFRAWRATAARQGLSMNEHGLKVQSTYGAVADYVQKWGHEPERRPWGAADELARANSKRGRGDHLSPFDLLRWIRETGEVLPVALFREFAAAFYRRHQLEWSPGLRAHLGLGGELSDQELATLQQDEAVVLGRLSFGEWRAVCDRELRAQVLEAASSGEWCRVLAVVGGRPPDEGGGP